MTTLYFLGHGDYSRNIETEKISDKVKKYFTIGTIGYTNSLKSTTSVLNYRDILSEINDLSILDFTNGEIKIDEKDDECEGDVFCALNDATNDNLLIVRNKIKDSIIPKKYLVLFTSLDSISFFFLDKCGVFLDNDRITKEFLYELNFQNKEKFELSSLDLLNKFSYIEKSKEDIETLKGHILEIFLVSISNSQFDENNLENNIKYLFSIFDIFLENSNILSLKADDDFYSSLFIFWLCYEYCNINNISVLKDEFESFINKYYNFRLTSSKFLEIFDKISKETNEYTFIDSSCSSVTGRLSPFPDSGDKILKLQKDFLMIDETKKVNVFKFELVKKKINFFEVDYILERYVLKEKREIDKPDYLDESRFYIYSLCDFDVNLESLDKKIEQINKKYKVKIKYDVKM